MSGISSSTPPQPRSQLEQMVPQVFKGNLVPCLGLREHRALPCVSQALRLLRQPSQGSRSLISKPVDALVPWMSFLDYRDLGTVAVSHRRLEGLTRLPDALNPQYQMARHLRENENIPLTPIYQSPSFPVVGGRGRPPSTMGQKLGTHHLALIHGNTLLLKELPHGRELRVSFDQSIESCQKVDLPEPALVMGNRASGMKIVTLNFLLNNGDAELAFNALPALPVPEVDDGGGQISELAEPPFEWLSIKRSQIMASQGHFVAVAYRDYVMVTNLLHPSRSFRLPFKNAHQIDFRNDHILCLSARQCAVFDFKQSRTTTDEAPLRTFHAETPAHLEFAVAKLFASRLAIGYEQITNFHSHGLVSHRLVGASYDLQTGESSRLLNHQRMRGRYELNCFIENGPHLIGCSSRIEQWRREGGLPIPTPAGSPVPRVYEYDICTITALGDCIFSAAPQEPLLHPMSDFFHPHKIRKKLFPYQHYAPVNWADISGRFLIAEVDPTGTDDEHVVQVFDLLQEPVAGPLSPPSQKKNSDDGKEENED
jgi:hypothetical protein